MFEVCSREVSRIRVSQVGYPLPHGCQGVAYCVSSYRFTLLAVGSVTDCEDNEVEDFAFRVSDSIEGRGLAQLFTELGPPVEDLAGRRDSFGGVGSRGELQSKLEISLEAILGGRCSSCHGMGCGYSCSKWARKAGSVRCWRREASSDMTLAVPGMW